MEKKLEVKNLQVSFRTQAGTVKAVRDISFDLYKGETLAIVGESGSGKSVTSKAIIGILAGNSIVEGGEILYDGQDLLKISEDDFHKIRGDKISMIFQDPLSSLNPIMRVGKQLTEAMILNGKMRQKSAKKEFNGKLKLLVNALNGCNENKENNKKQVKMFDTFCIKSTQLEQAYNSAIESCISLKSESENNAFLLSKKQKLDRVKVLKRTLALLKDSVNPFLVVEDEEYKELMDKVIYHIKDGKKLPRQDAIELLQEMAVFAEKNLKKEKPNFFRLGFYLLNNPDFDYSSISVEELDKLTRSYLDDNFMDDFIALGSEGIKYSHEQSIAHKSELIGYLEELLKYCEETEVYNRRVLNKMVHEAKKKLAGSIDYLNVHKRSVEYSFYISLNHEVQRYFRGLKSNPGAERKHQRSVEKYNRLVEKGKHPTWKVVPPTLVNIELTKSNICKIISSLINSIHSDIDNTDKFDSKAEMIDLVDFLKDEASKVVYKVTKKLAKAKALELLKEVGIPEPAIRYKQYPFEFSGGMRQRIVIAIALSANPDILICDEPTTALDVTIQSQILELINRIKEERHLSVIFITHDLGVVANMADRIAVMYAGKIVEYGSAQDIFYDPKHPYTWALLSSMPDLETKEKLEAIPGTPPNMIFPPKGDAFADRNKYALEIDFEMQPPLFKVSESHYAATWLLHPDAPKVEPPSIIKKRIERMKEKMEAEHIALNEATKKEVKTDE